ncbi:hypothetical protein [Caldicellulosiruptor bescii]|nr:hypothetical protein [Caldicellulosiruptor bescii]
MSKIAIVIPIIFSMYNIDLTFYAKCGIYGLNGLVIIMVLLFKRFSII